MPKIFILFLFAILIVGCIFSYIIASNKSISENIELKVGDIYSELLNNPNEIILKYVHLPYNFGYGSN
jgi:hypothetical protein